MIKKNWLLLFVVCLACVTACSVCRVCNSPDAPQIPAATIEHQNNPRIYFTPSLDCENNIVAEINKAKKIDIAVYSITNRQIVDAILVAHKRGVVIRVITDRSQSKGKGSLVSELVEAGIPVVTNIKHKIEHNKFAVFDGKHVVSGSYNWTTNASKYNSENCVFFDQPDKEYSTRFEYLWKMYHKK